MIKEKVAFCFVGLAFKSDEISKVDSVLKEIPPYDKSWD